MSDKSYSNCPLKKRPIPVVDDEDEVELDVDDDSQPVDLSIPRRYGPYHHEPHLSDSEQQSCLRLTDYDGDFPHPIDLPKYAYSPDVSYLVRPDDSRESPASTRESSISPPVLRAGIPHHMGYSQSYRELVLNHNNNVIKEEQYQIDQRSMISPASSHLSYGSTHSEPALSLYTQPEDLSVKPIRKTVLLSDSRDNIRRTRRETSDRENLYYQCGICKKSYSTAAGLIKHEQCHSLPQDLSKTKVPESSVIVGSDRIGDLRRVHNSKHPGVPRYQCPDCGKSYSTYSGLTKHQQFHCPAAEGNQTKKFFSCKNCDKVYVSLGALKMHIRTHTLPCKCPLCGKAFSRPWLLQGHIRTHTGEKPFTCQHCHRAFADRSNLRAHLQTHSDVKKYSCTSCSKTFSRMSLLGKHVQGGCPGNPVSPQNGMSSINCEYSAMDQAMYYNHNGSASYGTMRNPDYSMHQEYSPGDHQHYKEDLRAY